MAEACPGVIPEVEWVSETIAIPADLPGDWFVAHTRARNEKALVEDLTRMGVFHYLPLVPRETRSPRTGRISRSTVPVFPGYVFFHATEEQRYRALMTHRIAKVLVVPNQAQLVAELRRIHCLIHSRQDFFVAYRLEVGDWGRILAGPLRGLEGVVLRRSGRWRLSMNVTILGQGVQVEVSRDNVERIEPPVYAGERASRRGA